MRKRGRLGEREEGREVGREREREGESAKFYERDGGRQGGREDWREIREGGTYQMLHVNSFLAQGAFVAHVSSAQCPVASVVCTS